MEKENKMERWIEKEGLLYAAVTGVTLDKAGAADMVWLPEWLNAKERKGKGKKRKGKDSMGKERK